MPARKIQPKSSIWLKVAGWACVAVGLLGLVLPVIPGIALLVAGLVTLSSQHRWARELLVVVKRRYRKSVAHKVGAPKASSATSMGQNGANDDSAN
jgi:uncharacterized membrane protein YbaN (DUF454 family)